jgi:hypothetical protein
MIFATDTLTQLAPEDYSNFSLFGIGKPSKGQLKRKDKRTVGVCTQPIVPDNLLNHRKWNQYRACLHTQYAQMNEQKANEIAQAREEERLKAQQEAQAHTNAVSDSVTKQDISDINASDDKILGMPKGVAIGLGVAIVALGGFLVYKKFIAKK